ncbi:hypothetical protein PHLH3_23110 [Pseudomonas sp. St386]|nr:hypothetical protein PHLH3_23110 [Pseudomonas sp. St386]
MELRSKAHQSGCPPTPPLQLDPVHMRSGASALFGAKDAPPYDTAHQIHIPNYMLAGKMA